MLLSDGGDEYTAMADSNGYNSAKDNNTDTHLEVWQS